MAASSTTATDRPRVRPRRSAQAITGSFEGWAGLGLVALFVLVVVLGPTVAPYSPTESAVCLPDTGPAAGHPLGCDALGRDVLSRILHGGASVIAVPLAATVLAFGIGGTVGMVAGYRGGGFDRIASVAIDVLLAVPPLLVVLVVITAAGGSAAVIVLSVGIVYAPRVARILRGATQAVATSDYVAVAQARGERTLSIVMRETLPNIAPTVFVEFAVRLTYVIIFVATLNFLGLGAQPPSSNWGLMVAESRATIVQNPIATLAPALSIALLSIGISLLADAVTHHRRVPGAEDYTR